MNLKPSKANLPENQPLLVEYNKLKSIKNNTVSDLNVGDKVRVYIKKSMEKGTEPQYSNEVYIVESMRGKTITLNNKEQKRRRDLLLVPSDTIGSNEKNIIRKETKKYKVEQQLNKESIDNKNIVQTKRIRKANKKYS